MARLQEQLEYFVHSKLSTDKLWQNIRVYLSGHEVCAQLKSTLVWVGIPLIQTVFLPADSRRRRAQDHGVHPLGEQQAGPRPQHPPLPLRPGC